MITLVSCEGNTDREWSIDNQSSTAIHFKAKLNGITDTTMGTVEKGEARILIIASEDKANADPQIPWDVFSYIFITNENGDTMLKEWQENTNWDIYIEETQQRPSKQLQTYVLIVKDNDF